MSEKYAFIEAEHATVAADTACAPSITQMCSWLQVSRSGFYEWRSRPESATAKRRQELKLLITKALEDSDGTSGYRRIAVQLARWGIRARQSRLAFHDRPEGSSRAIAALAGDSRRMTLTARHWR